MKTFKDLVFITNALNGRSATINFRNGYGASVITGHGSYTSAESPYEIAVLYKDDITYNSPITNDIIGFLKEHEVTEIMAKIKNL